MSELVLGIDTGTASTKGVLTTLDGSVVATAVRHHTMSLPRPSWAEVDAAVVWWDDFAAVARELMDRIGSHTLAGLCVSGVGPCLLVCDSDVEPVRPAILYGIDGRAEREIRDLTERLGADTVLERCGKALSTQAVGPKMLWMRRNEPRDWARGTRWYNSHSYLAAKLTGAYVLDHHTASQCDPLYDIHAGSWAQDWLPDIVGHLEMPRLVHPHEVVGTVTAAASEATKIPVGTPVSAGTIDAWAEAHSAGVRHPGDLMLMYGSTLFFVQVLGRYRAHPKLWTTAGVEPGRRTIAAGMSTSGSLTQWLQDVTGGESFDTLVTEAEAVPAGSDGLLMLPYFAGERTPIFDPHARGVVAGLTLRHTRGHLFRAAYEGIAFGVRQILDFLEDPDDPVRRVVAVGGGTRGGLWTQIVSDVTGREQQVPAQTMGACYGDALLSAVGLGLVPRDTDWAVTGTTVRPQAHTREIYDRLYASYTALYPATLHIVHDLADMQ
ncbi:FGGY-family carbohydrate kinase [Streptomyces sp. NPDC059466]|uniref:FGGY-family carbohydrate kinase n=1 Tax=unclassified Streptomyces TaxID=2593676 RepID=UPI0036CAB315